MRSHQWAFLWNCLAMAGVELEAWLRRSFCLPDSSRAACIHLALCPGSVCAMGLRWRPCPGLRHTAPIPSAQGALWQPSANLAPGAFQSCEHEGVCISHVARVPRVTWALCHPKSSRAVGVGGVRWGHRRLCQLPSATLPGWFAAFWRFLPQNTLAEARRAGWGQSSGCHINVCSAAQVGFRGVCLHSSGMGVKKENGLGRKAHNLRQLAVSWKLSLLIL